MRNQGRWDTPPGEGWQTQTYARRNSAPSIPIAVFHEVSCTLPPPAKKREQMIQGPEHPLGMSERKDPPPVPTAPHPLWDGLNLIP